MKKNCISRIMTIIIFLYSINICNLSAGTKQSEPGRIHLSFFYMDDNKMIKTLPLDEKPATLKTGNRLKLYFKPLTTVYFYLFHLDKEYKITPLFPETFDTPPQVDKELYIPAGAPDEAKEYWITLRDTGPEIFYIIASSTRLEKLELLTTQYHRQEDDQGETLHTQLKRLSFLSRNISQHQTMLQDQLVKLKTIDGVFKGRRFKIHTIIVRDIYVKKITINH